MDTKNKTSNDDFNATSHKTDVIASTGDFIRSKNISIYQQDIIGNDYKTYSLFELLDEYANIYSKKYLCYAEIIDMIDSSEDLKELEVLINRKFRK